MKNLLALFLLVITVQVFAQRIKPGPPIIVDTIIGGTIIGGSIIPPGPPNRCTCGTWGSLVLGTTTDQMIQAKRPKKYECGSSIEWSCNSPFQFTTSYQCSPSDESCQAKTKWDVRNVNGTINSGIGTNSISGVFTLIANGTYTLTLNATCNGKECPPCTYTIIVKDCLTCACGTWGSLWLYPASDPTAPPTRLKKYECGSSIDWSCKSPFKFTASYQCSPSDASCQAQITWDVRNVNGTIKTGTGTNNISDVFTPIANGTYTLTLNAKCNGIQCLPCTYTIIVKDCLACACGTWGSLMLSPASGPMVQASGLMIPAPVPPKNYQCGSNIEWSCKSPFQFTASYQCSPSDASCKAQTTWDVKNGSVTIKSGIGTNSINDVFTLIANGTYTLTLNATCNGMQCPSCTFTVTVKDCK